MFCRESLVLEELGHGLRVVGDEAVLLQVLDASIWLRAELSDFGKYQKKTTSALSLPL